MDRKKVANAITGIFLLLAGICILGQLAGFWNLALVMNAWWTLFLIVPAIASMVVSGPRTGNVFLLLMGVWLFLDCQGWLGNVGWPMMGGLFLIFIGIRIILRGDERHHERHHHRHHDDEPDSNIAHQ